MLRRKYETDYYDKTDFASKARLLQSIWRTENGFEFEKYGNFPVIRKGVDMLFSYNLIQQGEKILFDPKMKVSHAGTTNFSTYLKKQVLHGEYSLATRKEASLPGSFLSTNFGLIPFLPFIRTLMVLKHIVSLEIGLMKDFLLSFPIFFMGSLAWSFGFSKGMLK